MEAEKLRAELPEFLHLMHKQRLTYQKNINIKIIPEKSKESKKSLRLSKSQYMPSKLWVDLRVDYVCKLLYPSCMLLLELSLLFPLSVACAERVFSKIKLIKTRLHNKHSQVSFRLFDSHFN